MRRTALVVIALLAIALVPAGTSAAPRSGGGRLGPDIRELDPACQARAHAVSAGEEGDPRIRRFDAAPTRASRGGRRAVLVGHGHDAGRLREGVHAPGHRQQHRGVGLERRGRDLVRARLPGGRLSQRRRAQRHHRRPGQLPDRPVRHQHVPDRVERVQRGASSRRQERVPREAPRPPQGLLQGPGDRIVTLIDNVRDENFYDTNNATSQPYIAGFYTSFYDDLTNRLVMSVDSFDWIHRTGANPPNAAVVGSVPQRDGASVPVRGNVRARVPAPARELRRRRRGELGERGCVRLRPDDHRLRRSIDPGDADRVRQPHPGVPRDSTTC